MDPAWGCWKQLWWYWAGGLGSRRFAAEGGI